MTDSCFVADIYWRNPIDFTKLRAASWSGVTCEAIIHKASQGAGFDDPMYSARRPKALAAGFLWGAYAFNTGELVAAQVKEFLDHAQPDAATALFLDFEDNTKSEMTLDQAIEFLDRVDQAVGCRCGIYSGNRLKQTIVRATDAQRDFLSSRSLWGCQYGPTWKNFDVNGRALPWAAPFLWQFTGDGVGPEPHTLDGLQAGTDLSRFNGSRVDLEKLWSGASCAKDAAPIAVAPSAPTPPAKPVAVAANDGWLSNFLKKLRG